MVISKEDPKFASQVTSTLLALGPAKCIELLENPTDLEVCGEVLRQRIPGISATSFHIPQSSFQSCLRPICEPLNPLFKTLIPKKNFQSHPRILRTYQPCTLNSVHT